MIQIWGSRLSEKQMNSPKQKSVTMGTIISLREEGVDVVSAIKRIVRGDWGGKPKKNRISEKGKLIAYIRLTFWILYKDKSLAGYPGTSNPQNPRQAEL